MRGVRGVVGADHCTGSGLHRRHGRRMAQADLRGWADHPHESVWDDVLFAGRIACDARGGGSDRPFVDSDLHADGTCEANSIRSAFRCSRSTGILWTRCGWWFSLWCTSWAGRAGSRHGGDSTTQSGSGARRDDSLARADGVAHCAGVRLHGMAAGGLVTSLWVTAFGAVLMVAGCVGWFRQVLPHEEHEEVPVVVQPVTITTSRKVVRRLEIGLRASRAPAGGDVSGHQRDQGRDCRRRLR
jgi:hypothetical protein